MKQEEIERHIIESFKGTHVVKANGDSFFFYGDEKKFPFATIVTTDNDFDNVSKLDREDFYRVNVGIDKVTFNTLFGAIKSQPGISGYVNSGIDFTVSDEIMPHPIYGSMYWICVVNPDQKTFTTLHAYLATSYDKAVKSHDKKNNSPI